MSKVIHCDVCDCVIKKPLQIFYFEKYCNITVEHSKTFSSEELDICKQCLIHKLQEPVN